MRKEQILPYREKRHYNRHPKLRMADGTEVKPLRTRYTDLWKWRTSKEVGPRGGKRYERFPRMVYYLDGLFWRNESVERGPGDWVERLVPVDGAIWDAHPIQSREQGIPVVLIRCEGGRPTVAEHDDFGVVWVETDGLAVLEDWLHIDGRREKGGRKAK